MKTWKSTYINAKEVKSELKKLSGVKVLRCVQHREGILLAIDSNKECQAQVLNWLHERNIKTSPTINRKVVNTSMEWVELGGLFKWEEIVTV